MSKNKNIEYREMILFLYSTGNTSAQIKIEWNTMFMEALCLVIYHYEKIAGYLAKCKRTSLFDVDGQ